MANTQEAIQVVRQLLTTGDEADRCNACRTLATLGDSTAVTDLAERLRDDDIDVCIDAADALGRLGDQAAVAPLLETLRNDPVGEIKIVAVEALGRLGGDEVIPQLLEIAEKSPEELVWEEDGDESWDSWWDMQLKAVEALGNLRVAEAAPTLTAILEDESGQDIEEPLLSALARIGDTGEAVLFQRLKQGTPRQRRRAARALRETKSTESYQALIDAFADSEEDVREAAVETLAIRGDAACLTAVLALLQDTSPQVRRAALQASNHLCDTIDTDLEFDTLFPLLNDDSPAVRQTALRILDKQLSRKQASAAISEIPENIYQQIRTLLLDQDTAVAIAACSLASRLEDEETQATLLKILADTSRDSALRREAALALGQQSQINTEVLEGLANALTDTEQTVRLGTLNALRTLADNQDYANEVEDKTLTPVALIIGALRGEVQTEAEDSAEEDSDTIDEQEQAELSQQQEKAEETTALVDNDSEDDETIVAEANEAAVEDEEESDEEHIAAVVSAANSPALSTLEAISLGNIEASRANEDNAMALDDIPDITQLSDDEKEALGNYYHILEKNKAMKERLFDAPKLDTATDVRCLAARILGDSKHPAAITALKEAIHDEQPEVQQEVIEALAQAVNNGANPISLNDVIGPLTSFLHLSGQQQLRLASIRVLGALGNPMVVSSLLEYLEDNNVLIRVQIVHALANLLRNYEKQHTTPLGSVVDGDLSDEIINALVSSLADKASGVRTSAANALGDLKHFIKSNELRQDIVDRLISAGFDDEGGQARDMGHALRTVDSALAGDGLVKQLETLPTSAERRFAIEMLEEVFKPAVAA